MGICALFCFVNVPLVVDELKLLSESSGVALLSYGSFYLIFYLLTYPLDKTIQKTPLPFFTILCASLYSIEIFLTYFTPFGDYQPYVVVIILRVVLPMVFVEYTFVTEILNNVMIIIALLVSYKVKTLNFFITDLFNCFMFSLIGTFVCTFLLRNQIYYFSKKDDELDKDLEVAKLKNEAKNAFLANMSHEIRTPINAILGFDEMILRECRDKVVTDYATSIKQASNTLLGLVNDVLDFSKIEAGNMSIVCTEYEISSSICDLINMFAKKVSDKHLRFNVYVDEGVPHLLYGDEMRLKQCVINLLNNAIKYTEQGSVTLNIGYEKVDSGSIMLKVMVKDTGIGIKPEDRERLFKPFERLEEKRNRTIEGSGLGLSIVVTLLEKMGSHLEVFSEYGQGSEFSFAIKQQVVWWSQIGNFNDRYKKYLSRRSFDSEAFIAPEARILVVDDTQMNLLVVEGLLKRTKITVDTALSGFEALKLVQQNKYDVIFIDHRMPQMDGIETFNAMKALDNSLNKRVPCIMFTANAVSGSREMFMAAGFSDYLTKPVDYKQLERLLMKYLPDNLITVSKMSAAKQMAMQEPEEKEVSSAKGIDITVALHNCGTAGVLRDAIKEYRANIEEKATLVEQYLMQKNFKEYTVQVHSIKSSSKLIGAMQLSEQAAYLEHCGDNNDIAEMLLKTPDMLKLYRSYIENFAAFADDSEKNKNVSKPPIDDVRYKEAIEAIKEFASSFDFNAIDGIIEMLDSYEIPEKERDTYKQIKRFVRSADSESLMKIII